MKSLSPVAQLLRIVLPLACMVLLPLSAHTQGRGGEGQLWQAALDGDLQKVKSSVEAGANVNSRGAGGFAPLLCAARNGHLEVVQYLVEHGANVDQSDNNRDKTPLLAASFKGHFEIVKYLVEKGANLNAQSINGFTALHDAAYVGNFEIVKFLVDHNADLHLRNEKGETALVTVQRALQTGQPWKGHRTNASREEFQQVIDYLKSHGG